jgi:hypothetical protein
MVNKMTNLSTTPKTFCFVLMPFNEDFDDIYQLGIKEACNLAGAYSERVDEQIFQETISARIYNQIAKADIVIADMSGRNPNVFYEVGYAHALGKPTILLTQNAKDIPFDLKDYPHIIYEKKITKLKDELTSKIKWFIENPLAQDDKYRTEIDLYLGEKNLSGEDVVYAIQEGKSPEIEIVIHNNSSRTYEAGDITIGIITSKKFRQCYYAPVPYKPANTVALPTTEFIHNITNIGTLFPQAYTKLQFLIPNKSLPANYIETITIRIFSEAGIRDYPLTLRK